MNTQYSGKAGWLVVETNCLNIEIETLTHKISTDGQFGHPRSSKQVKAFQFLKKKSLVGAISEYSVDQCYIDVNVE